MTGIKAIRTVLMMTVVTCGVAQAQDVVMRRPMPNNLVTKVNTPTPAPPTPTPTPTPTSTEAMWTKVNFPPNCAETLPTSLYDPVANTTGPVRWRWVNYQCQNGAGGYLEVSGCNTPRPEAYIESLGTCKSYYPGFAYKYCTGKIVSEGEDVCQDTGAKCCELRTDSTGDDTKWIGTDGEPTDEGTLNDDDNRGTTISYTRDEITYYSYLAGKIAYDPY